MTSRTAHTTSATDNLQLNNAENALRLGDVVHVQLRVNPTPGKYHQRHLHSASFVDGRDTCVSCANPLKTVDSFAMNVADLSAPALSLLAAVSSATGVYVLPFNLCYENERTAGELIDAGDYPHWQGHHGLVGGTLDKFRSNHPHYLTRGWEVYGGRNQRTYDPAEFLNHMAARNAEGGWHPMAVAYL